MHKTIVKAIELALTQHDKSDLLDIFVQAQPTEGFWAIVIIPKPNYKHLLNHIEHIGTSIGRFYGEGLCVKKTSEYIRFN